MEEKPLKPLNIPLTGKLKTSVDGSQLSEGDFQVLENMRHTNAGLKSIGGMTKINTSGVVEPTVTYPKFRSGIHFIKDEPSESHVLVQAWNSGMTASKIYRNDTTIPNAGAFNTTALYTESSGADVGTFSSTPDGCVAYCNGKESLIWGGNEYRVGAFLDNDGGTTNYINYTETVNKTLQVYAFNLQYAVSANIPVMLLHFNTDLTDSASIPHTITGNGGIAIDTSQKRFGAASCYFDGVNDYLTTPDFSDLDFSGGGFTIDFWIYAVSPTGSKTWQIYYQEGGTVNDYFSIFYNVDASVSPNIRKIYLQIKATTLQVNLSADMTTSEWNHVRVAENGNDYCIFINGMLGGYVSSANRSANYANTVYIGYNPNSASSYFNGWLDDFKISSAVSLSNFIPYQTEIDNNVNKTFIFIGSPLPLQGIKPYLVNVNNSASTVLGTTWNGKQWKALTNLSDGTSTGGVSLASNGGSVSFDSTASISKPRVVNNIYAYWHLFTWSGLAGSVGKTTASIYHMTVNTPMQPIKDIWDGIKRIAYAYFLDTTDYTTHVTNTDYLSSDATTYVSLDNLATSSHQYFGFAERCTGLYFDLPQGHVNTTKGTILLIDYWDGNSWQSVGVIYDGTAQSIKSFNQIGYVSWNADAITDDNTQIMGGNSAPLYYYRMTFTQTLSADVKLDYVAGIPAQRTITNYKFPVNFHNRLWLCSDQSGERNKITISQTGTVSIFNGTDTTNFYIGDNTDIIAGGSLYGRYASSVSEQLILCKKDETWLIEGTTLANYTQFRVSNQYGCVAAKTFTICNIAYTMASGISKHVAIWQSSNAIVVFDGSSVMPVSFDIADIFDQRNAVKISLTMIHKSTAFYDEANSEWHWCWSSDGSTLNNEYVYDLIRQRWYTISRGTGTAIQLGIPVRDTNGNNYVYGAIDTGYLERLENGNTFDGNNIVSKFRTPDIPIAGWEEESLIRKVSLLTKTKATTTNKMAITHYGDMSNTGTSIGNLSVTDANKRVLRSMVSIGTGPYTFHSFECSMTTANEPIGFEPIGLQIFYKAIRPHLI